MRAGVSRADAIRWTCHVDRALAFSHGRRIVHRDVKPSNILLEDGTAYLADFGFARIRDAVAITHPDRVVGTLAYLAPEQARGEEVSPAADCFGLGLVLHRALLGSHPFFAAGAEGSNSAEVLRRIAALDIDPESLAGTGDSQIDSVLRRALAPRVEDRYPDAAAMLPELEALLQREAPLPEPPVASAPPPTVLSERSTVSATVVAAVRSAPPTLAAGATFGRYRIDREIGSGGQGVVYAATDPTLERSVALKVLRPDHRANQVVLTLFRNEARTAARLDHPHIIPVHDYGDAGGVPYLTMPLVRGPSLDRVIAEGRPLPVPACLRIVAQVADAPAYAHDEGIVHLDIKPANILLRSRRRSRASENENVSVIVTDFTLARWLVASERLDPGASGMRSSADSWCSGCTPAYAAPEQLEGDDVRVGVRSDLFSLGVVLFEILTGSPLFASLDDRRSHRSEPPPSPTTRRTDVPAGVDELCRCLLQIDPERRPVGARAVEDSAVRLLTEISDRA